MKPELRPAGPSPTRLASRTHIRSPGHSCDSLRAAASPAKPAPITSQSAVVLPSNGCAGSAAGNEGGRGGDEGRKRARNDGGIGLLLYGNSKGEFYPVSSLESGVMLPYDVKQMVQIEMSDGDLILVGNNNDKVVGLKNNKKQSN